MRILNLQRTIRRSQPSRMTGNRAGCACWELCKECTGKYIQQKGVGRSAKDSRPNHHPHQYWCGDPRCLHRGFFYTRFELYYGPVLTTVIASEASRQKNGRTGVRPRNVKIQSQATDSRKYRQPVTSLTSQTVHGQFVLATITLHAYWQTGYSPQQSEPPHASATPPATATPKRSCSSRPYQTR